MIAEPALWTLRDLQVSTRVGGVDELRHLPSLGETEAQMTDLVVRMGEAVSKIAPATGWHWVQQRQQSGCNMPRLYTTGLSVQSALRLSDVPIPEELWAPSLAAVREIASSVGIDRLVVRVDRPGDHGVQLVSEDGRLVSMCSLKAALFTTDAGCRLWEAERGGTP